MLTMWRNASLLQKRLAATVLDVGLWHLPALAVSLMKPVIAPGVRLLNRPSMTLLRPARRAVPRVMACFLPVATRSFRAVCLVRCVVGVPGMAGACDYVNIIGGIAKWKDPECVAGDIIYVVIDSGKEVSV